MTQQVLCQSDGINWIWYNQVTLDHDEQTAVIDAGYRLHKFDKYQGAGQHPKTEYRVRTYTMVGGQRKVEVLRYGPPAAGSSLSSIAERYVYDLCTVDADGVWTPVVRED